MSLEQQLQALTIAISGLTEAMANGTGFHSGAGNAEPAPDVEPENTQEADPTGLFDDVDVDTSKEYTITDIRKALAKLVDSRGESTAIDVLAKFDAKKLSDIKEADYAKFVAVVEKEV